MERAVAEYVQICAWDTARFFIISDNVFDHLIYYSHLLPIIVSVPLALIIFFKNRTLPSTRWFLVTTILLSVWLLFDLVLWASEKPEFIMFFWSIVNMVEPMIFAGSLFFIYSFINKKNMPFSGKLAAVFLLVPTVILASTNHNLAYFDLTNCEREVGEGLLPFYGYIIEILFTLWILIIGIRKFLEVSLLEDKNKIALVTGGMILFLLSFSFGNIIGSLSLDWQIGQYGLFGIPVFVAVLSYLIVKYHIFNTKLIATQVLVTGILILTAAILLIRDIALVRIIVGITLFLFTILGYLLIRSVKREVKQREELAIANAGQENLIHIMNHQIKGYLAKGRNIFAELKSEPDYCAAEAAKPMIEEGFKSLTEGVDFVQQVLNASNAEKGTLTYTMKPLDFRTLVQEAAENQRGAAVAKGLTFEARTGEGRVSISADDTQLKEAVRNLIDNSIRYTQTGSVTVDLRQSGNKALLTVKDTGVGIDKDDMAKLFQKGGRGKDSLKYNVNSTGYGLAFVKGVVDAHKGRVWAESTGTGKGSTFYLELPLA